jgi:hypothetical protein
MLTRLRKLLLESRVCGACERYEATQGFLCVYCYLEAKLQTPGQAISNPSRYATDARLQDLSLLPPYIN